MLLFSLEKLLKAVIILAVPFGSKFCIRLLEIQKIVGKYSLSYFIAINFMKTYITL